MQFSDFDTRLTVEVGLIGVSIKFRNENNDNVLYLSTDDEVSEQLYARASFLNH
jgi:hypothetical protein